MAQVIALDFAAYEPRLTPQAHTVYDKWRKPLDDLMHGCRVAGDWVWAGDLSYRVNAVKRMCRKMPQPVSLQHMEAILELVSDHHRLPVQHDPMVTLTA